jgi:clorobiocin biosynthesis protein CloN5
MHPDELSGRLISFIQENLLSEDHHDITVDATTPLLELGVLDSLKTAILLNFIHHELKVSVPPEKLSSRNFRDVHSIAATISDILATSERLGATP